MSKWSTEWLHKWWVIHHLLTGMILLSYPPANTTQPYLGDLHSGKSTYLWKMDLEYSRCISFLKHGDDIPAIAMLGMTRGYQQWLLTTYVSLVDHAPSSLGVSGGNPECFDALYTYEAEGMESGWLLGFFSGGWQGNCSDLRRSSGWTLIIW